MTFIDRLKSLRKEKGISQKKLAAILNISQQAVAKWETGSSSPDPDMICNISTYFNVSIDYLLGNSDNKQTGTATPVSPSAALQEIEKILNDANIPQSEKDDLFQRFTQIYFLSKEKNEKK